MVRVPRLLLRAEFVIDFDAADFVEAGAYQRRLAEVFAGLQQQYPDARLSLRERKARDVAPAAGSRRESSEPVDNGAGGTAPGASRPAVAVLSLKAGRADTR